MRLIKNIKLFSITILGVSLMASCTNEDELKTTSVVKSIEVDRGVKTELDIWADKNFTTPYNTKLIFKYDDTKVSASEYVTPVYYKKAVQMANILKYLFFEPFEKNTSLEFMKRFAPREIVLLGSAAYKPNGTRVLGQAESGVKFSLFEINELNIKNREDLFAKYFRTIFHEFAHILHQTEMFSEEFSKISASDYVGDSWSIETTWIGKEVEQEYGFVTRYSANKKEDDFAELFAHYLTLRPEAFQALVNKGYGERGNPKFGGIKLEKKVEILKEYMLNTWDVDMDKLRDEILEKASKLDQLDVNSLK